MVSGGGSGGPGKRNWKPQVKDREKKLIWSAKVAKDVEAEHMPTQERAPANQRPPQAGDAGTLPRVSPYVAGGRSGTTHAASPKAPEPVGKGSGSTAPAMEAAQSAKNSWLDAKTSQFLPQGTGWSATTSMSASASEFVPSFSAGAKPFVPGQSFSTETFSTNTQSFVPGQSTWGWQEASWQPQMNAFAAEFEPGAGSMASAAGAGKAQGSGAAGSVAAGPQGMNMEEWACWFNDAYSTESSSAENTPRAKASPKTSPPAAHGSGPGQRATAEGEPVGKSAGAHQQAAHPPPGFEGPKEPASSLATEASQEQSVTVAPKEPPVVESQEPPATTEPPEAKEPAEDALPAEASKTAPEEEEEAKKIPPTLQLDSAVSSPKSVSSPSAARSSPQTLRTQAQRGSGEPSEDGSEEWEELPDAMEEVDEEVKEEELQKWLQRFSYDLDVEVLIDQWMAWTCDGEGIATQIVCWLLRCGLDDMRQAKHATRVYEELLRNADLALEMVEDALAEYSDEDIDDVRLDNPKVDEFVAAVRKLLSDFRPSGAPQSDLAGNSQENESTAPAAGASASTAAARYPLRFMLEARRIISQAGGEWTGPCWRTAKASKLFAPMPSWQQQRMAAKEERQAESAGAGGESWRDTPKKVIPEVKKKSNDGRRKEQQTLQVSGTSWVAQIRRLKEKEKADADAEADAAFLRELRLTLNKLTIERFDQLSDHLVELISKCARPNHGIPVLMQLVFEKATTQHHFIDMYVNLCVKLHNWLTANEDLVNVDSQTSLKRILLNQCQNSFEQYLEPPGGLDGLKGDILYEAQVKYKTKMLGNIKLIGELIRHGMLSAKIALAVAAELAHDDPLVREERLETLAVFLETIGPSLDDPSWSHFAQFDAIFQQVDGLVENRTVPRRIRYLLRDVVDMRRDKWRTRKARAFESDAPMTIAEVHRKALQDQFAELRGGAKTISLRAARKEDGILSSDGGSRKRKKRRRKRADGTTTSGTSGVSGSSDTAEQLLSQESDAQTSSAETSGARRTRPKASAPGTPTAAGTDTSASASGSPQVGPEKSPAAQRSVPNGDLPTAAASMVPRAKPREELLLNFHKEVAQIIRQLGNGVDVITAIQRLHACPVPADCYQEEIIDMLARMVDEPRQRRGRLFPLLPALFSAGIFSPPRLLGTAVSTFIQDAFADPGSVDPPDLGDIVLRELLPALGLASDAVTLPPCLAELIDEADGRK
mmetsp:Transcript_75346/g.143392  ORF Transcript_75346/g.143392 Transcript_75346/m.143392 type:complete len:1222 (+) Transcript_75346:182-3847(+)